MVTDHKNLEYFSQFNLVICLCPGKLGTKPDSLTRCWDIYPKGGHSDYATVNLSNFCLMFTQEQISISLRATELLNPVLRATVIMDQEQLNSDILSTLPNDPLYIAHLKELKLCWSVTPDGFLCHDSLIYIPDSNDLWL